MIGLLMLAVAFGLAFGMAYWLSDGFTSYGEK